MNSETARVQSQYSIVLNRQNGSICDGHVTGSMGAGDLAGPIDDPVFIVREGTRTLINDASVFYDSATCRVWKWIFINAQSAVVNFFRGIFVILVIVNLTGWHPNGRVN